MGPFICTLFCLSVKKTFVYHDQQRSHPQKEKECATDCCTKILLFYFLQGMAINQDLGWTWIHLSHLRCWHQSKVWLFVVLSQAETPNPLVDHQNPCKKCHSSTVLSPFRSIRPRPCGRKPRSARRTTRQPGIQSSWPPAAKTDSSWNIYLHRFQEGVDRDTNGYEWIWIDMNRYEWILDMDIRYG